MRHYHDDYLKHLTDAALAKNPSINGLTFDKVYSSKKTGWKIIKKGCLKVPLFASSRYWSKLDAVFICDYVNAFKRSEGGA